MLYQLTWRMCKRKYSIPGNPGGRLLALLLVACGLFCGPSAFAQFLDGFPGQSLNVDVFTDNVGSVPGFNGGFTKQTGAGEPNHAANAGNASAWATWIAPSSGTYTFQVTGDFDTILAVYTGGTVGGLALVNQANNPGTSGESFTFAAAAGTTYRVVVDGAGNGVTGAQGTFTVSWAGPPVNDSVLAARNLGSTVLGSVTGNNILSTSELGEFNHFSTSTPGRSVWYRWTAPANGLASFSTIGSSYDSVIAAYRLNTLPVAFANMTLMAENDDINLGAGILDARITFPVTAGTVYFIAVDGYFGATGNIVLNWDAPPSNDNFVDSVNLNLTGTFSGLVTGSNLSATSELGEPVHFAQGGASIWYHWTAPASGTVIFTTAGSNFDTMLGIYTGTAVNALTIIAQDDDSGGYPVAVATFTAVAGVTYRIAVDGYGVLGPAETGSVTLSWLYASNAGQFGFTATTTSVTETEGSGTALEPLGANLTITRRNGFVGRMLVDVTFRNLTAIGGTDYDPITGTVLTIPFDDFQMSTNLIVNIRNNTNLAPTLTFEVAITNVRPDPSPNPVTGYLEDQTLVPQIDTASSTNRVTIKNDDVARPIFLRQRYTITEGTTRNIGITRNLGAPAIGAFIRANSANVNNVPAENRFALLAGSDYAQANDGSPGAITPDFAPFPGSGSFVSETENWADNATGVRNIAFTALQDSLVEFNEDIFLSLHSTETGNPQIDTAMMTILFDRAAGQEQATGAVDRDHNPDLNLLTSPPNNTTPGANGPVFAVAVQANQRTVVAGDFLAYNTVTRRRIARMNFDGSLDTTFNPGNGPDGYVSALALQSDQKIIAGGGFFSYDGVPHQGVTRINTDGSVDNTFNPGSGAEGAVRAVGIYPATAGAEAGKIIIAGEFTGYNGTNINYIARLRTDGSLDTPSFGIGTGPNGPVYAVAISASGKIAVGGDFTEFDGSPRNGIAVLNADGSLDTTFNPGAGANNTVNAVAFQTDGKVVVGGAFTQMDLRTSARIARLHTNGSLDTGFYTSSGFDDSVFTLAIQPDGRILAGGIFARYHGVRRIGMARLLANGSLDTSFMDTAYNQFAGVINRLSTEPKNFISALGLQDDGNIIIGGTFKRIGGGFRRDDVRSRFNVCRVIGGQVDGPGNIQFTQSNYTVDENSGTLFVTLTRDNGSLAAARATFSTSDRPTGPGAAQAGVDYQSTIVTPIWISAQNSILAPGTPKRITEALMGPNNDTFLGTPLGASQRVSSGFDNVNVGIIDNTIVQGDRIVNLRLSRATDVEIVPLGGESIPFGVALGADQATLTIVENDFNHGILGLTSTEFTVTENGGMATVTITRTNGTDGTVSIDYTTSNGTATGASSSGPGVDYLLRSGRLTLPSGVTSASFNIPIINDSLAEPDETIVISLFNPAGGAQTNAALFPISATVKILDNDFAHGRLSISPSTYTVSESTGAVTVTVTRTGGNVGALSVKYSTADVTTTAGSDYVPVPVGTPGILMWNDGETTPKTITIPISQDGEVEAATETFTVNLSDPRILATGATDPLLLGTTTGTVTIQDSDIPGTLQLVSSAFTVSENGGEAIITVERLNGSSGNVLFNYGTSNTFNARPIFRFDVADEVNDGANTIHVTRHGLVNGQIVRIVGGTAPGNLAAGINYFVVGATADTFQLAATSGGVAIDIAPAGASGDTCDLKFIIGFDSNAAVAANTITLTAHPYANGDQVVFDGTVPAGGVIAGTTYFVINRTANTFQIAATAGGPALVVTPSGSPGAITSINSDEAGYVHVAGTVQLAQGVSSGQFRVPILDNLVQNRTLAGTFNRTLALSLPTIINAASGSPLAATLTIVDDEFINEPAGGVDQAYNSLAGANGFVYSLRLQNDGNLLIGGDFTTFNGIGRTRLARLLPNGDLDATFTVGTGADASIRAIELQGDNKIIIGGLFTNYNGTNRARIARINLDGSIDLNFSPGAAADNPVYALKIHRDPLNLGKIVVGGAFSKFNGQNRPHLVRLNTNGAIDTLFQTGSGPDGDVHTVAIQNNGRILIGGDFTNYNGQAVGRVARLLPNGQLDTSFTPQFDGTVRSLLVQSDGRILVGGYFTNANGQPFNYLARLEADGTLDAAFDPGAGGDRPVLSLALQPDGKILVAGDFLKFSDVTRRSLTRLNSDGSPDAGINFGQGANSFVTALAVQPTDGRIIAGGGFTQFDGQPRSYLVRLHGGVIAGPGRLQFNLPQFVVSENETNAVVHIRRIGGTDGSVSVDFNTEDILPAGAGKASALDYTAIAPPMTVVFPHAETFQEMRITINNDTVIEGDELLNLTLSNPSTSPPYGLGNQPVATLRIVDNDSAVFFAQTLFSVSENDPTGAKQILLVRTGGITGTLTVRLSTVDGTAVAGSDFIALSSLVTFLPGETNKTVALPIINDAIDEGLESLSVSLTYVSGDGVVGTPAQATVSILNDDFAPGVIQFTQSGYTVDENGGSITLTVVRTNGSSGLVSVSFGTVSTGDAVGGVAVAAGVDFIVTNGSLAFSDGEKVKQITVRILSDSDAGETNETFQVQLSNPTGGAVVGFPNPATVNIINNNSAIFGQFSIAPVAPISESGITPITVNLTGRTTNQPVSVDYTLVGLTATAGADFVVASVTLTFPDLITSQTFDLDVLADNLVENPETLQVVLSNPLPGNGPSIATPTTDITILSTNTLPGTVVFREPVFSASESALEVEIVLERTNGITGAVAVDLTLSPGTAMAGIDYEDFVTVPLTVTWADGVGGPVTNKITLINDLIVEADETILVTMSNPLGGLVFATNGVSPLNTAVAVIVDDEIKAGSVDETFSPSTDGPVYDLAIWPGTNRITLVGDFRFVNSLTRSNVAQLNLDGTTFTGFNPGPVTLGGTNATVRSLLIYTNGTNIGKIIIGGRFDSVNGTPVLNVARLNPDGSVDTSFNTGAGPNAPVNVLQLQPDGKVLLGGDFNIINVTPANFVTRLNADGSVDTSFNIGAGADAPVNAMLLLDNGDVVVGGDFNLLNGVPSQKLARMNNAGTVDAAFATNLAGGFNNSVFALAQQQNGRILVGGSFTAVGTNSSSYMVRLNLDGTVDTAQFTGFGAGFNDSVFAITVQADQKLLVAGNFTEFNGVPHNRIVRLLASGGIDPTINFGTGADGFINSIVIQPDDKILIGGGFQSVDGQIRNNIARLNNGTNMGSGVFQFSASQFLVNENESTVGVRVSRLLGTALSTSVDVVTLPGTALPGVDYTASTNTLIFAEGETTKELRLPVFDDVPAMTNLNRIFYVELHNPTNNVGVVPLLDGTLLAARTNVSVVIVDNESVISFSSPSYVVAENGVNATILLTRTGGSNDPVTVRFETTVGSASEVIDYLAVTNDIFWAAGDANPKAVLIQINNDSLVEGIETVSLQLTNFTGSALPGVTNAVLNIFDDDFSAGVISFEQVVYNVVESQPAQIAIVRTNGSSGIVSVTLSSANGTALAGSDYTGTNVLVTFANGETRKVVNIATLDDALQDDAENFTLTLSGVSVGATLGTASANVIIDDNDVTIGFTSASVSVGESDTTLSLTVTRSGLDTRTFIVDYATANLAAQAGLDYLQTNGVIVFGPGETNKVIAVEVKDDFIIEGAESFTVNLSGTNLSLLGITQHTVDIVDNDLSTDLEVLVTVNNPVKTNTTVRYSLLVTNYGPSDISGVTLTNVLPTSLQLSSVSVTNVTTNGNTLIFDLPVLAKASGYLVEIEALDTNGVIRSVTNITAIGLPAVTNDLNLANNTVTNVTGLRGPGPYLAIESLSINSETPGPANGAFDINEQVSVNVTFRNLGDVASSAAAGSLLGTGGVITNVGPQNATFGVLAPGASAVRTFNFLVTGTNGGTLTVTFNLTDTGGIVYDPGVLRYRLGGTTSTGSTNQITINALGDATPYPDTITVSGLVGILDNVSLTLSNVTHSYPDDIDILLVSPAGQGVIVMADAGGDRSLNNTTFTINDLAATALPDNALIVNGTSYRPANYAAPDPDVFGAPAPAGPYFTSMSAFKGIDPNGQWHLFVRDDTTGDFGAISNGWSLNITTVFPANPTAGLVIAGTQTPGPLLVGADQTYTLLVTNRGPATATSVFVTNLFSGPFTFISASNSVSGAVTQPTGRVILALGSMANGAVVTNYITVRPTSSGNFTNRATVGIASSETDTFLGDNTLVFSQVVGANADLAVGVSTTPVGTVALGNNLTYNITLTNLGPSTATGVVITNVLPSGVNYVSGTSSQGVVSRSGSLVTATLGSMGVNGTATLTIVVTPTAAGSLTNTVTAASAVNDANTLNNVAVTTSTAVTDSADLLVGLTATPDPVTVGGNITYSITLTNRGPSTATSVVLTNPLPSSVTLVSFTTPQGTAANVSGAVVFTLGSVPTGTNVTMQVVVTANVAGVVNNTAFVTAGGTFDPVAANNSATLAVAVQSPSADIDLGASTLLTESITPSNGAIDPGETVTLRLELVNKGAVATGNLVATLLPTGGVATNSGPQVKTYGAIASGASAAQNYTFSASGNLGDTLSVTLQLQDGAVNLGTVTFTYQLGATSVTGSSSTITGVDVGPALTYPSVITVSGQAGTVLKATVTLSNVTHTFPDDLDILLVSPSGHKVLLVSDVGGGFALSGVNITLDDSAASSLPDSGVITDGVYKPSNYLNAPTDPLSTNDVFAAPAPAAPYAAKLAELVGTNPNGQWSLYVMDDQTGNVGAISGWSLSLVTVATIAPSADVALTVTPSPEPVTARSNLTYTITVTNSGPNGVSGVTVSNALPANVTLVYVATTQGSIVTNGNGAVIWTVGAMAANAQYQAAIVVAPDMPGSITNVTTVTHGDIELNASNNSVTTVSTVNGFVLAGGSINVTPGNISLTLVGQPGVTYVVEASTDLVNWVVISTQSSADGIIIINDPAGTSNAVRFYRARQQ